MKNIQSIGLKAVRVQETTKMQMNAGSVVQQPMKGRALLFGGASSSCFTHSSRPAAAGIIAPGHRLLHRCLGRWSRHGNRVIIVTLVEVVVSWHRINRLLIINLLVSSVLSSIGTSFRSILRLLLALTSFQLSLLKKSSFLGQTSSFSSIFDLILTDECVRGDAKDAFIFAELADPNIFRCGWMMKIRILLLKAPLAGSQSVKVGTASSRLLCLSRSLGVAWLLRWLQLLIVRSCYPRTGLRAVCGKLLIRSCRRCRHVIGSLGVASCVEALLRKAHSFAGI